MSLLKPIRRLTFRAWLCAATVPEPPTGLWAQRPFREYIPMEGGDSVAALPPDYLNKAELVLGRLMYPSGGGGGRGRGGGNFQCVDAKRAATGQFAVPLMVPQFDIEVDRIKTQTLHVTTDQIFSTLSSYMGSTFVNQFNKFGRTFQVYAQADAQFRLTPRDIQNMMVRNSNGDMIPLGTVAKITPAVGPSLISLYNLYPSATIIGLPAAGYSSGQSMTLMEEIRGQDAAAGHGLRVDGDVVPGEGRRRPDLLGVRPCPAAGVPRAGRTI